MTGMDEIGIVFLSLLVTVKVFQYDDWGENSMQKVEIRVKGGLDEHWSEWFQDFRITPGEKDETILVGEVIDQAALYGLIAKLRDLGLILIAVNEVG